MIEGEKDSNFFDFNTVDTNPVDFFKWIKLGLCEFIKAEEDEQLINSISECFLEKIDLVNQEKMNNQERAFLTHLILILRTDGLKTRKSEIIENIILGMDCLI